MLIDDELNEAKIAERLIPARPIATWAGEPRAFLMCTALRDAIHIGRTDPDPKVRAAFARLEAAIGLFVEGGLVTDDLVKQLLPPKYEHWELRSRRPSPSLRVFGRFAKPDVFVGTHCERRKELGGMWSREFEHQKLVCEDHWRAAGLSAPFTDAPHFRYERYITSNAYKKVRIPK